MSNFRIITIDELLKMLDNYNHHEMHLHHCWKPNHAIYNTRPDGVYWNQAMASFHINANGWSDIAQHVTLLPDGMFVTGRNFAMTPASIVGYNTGAFAVEMIGDFDLGKDVLEGKQRESIIILSRWFDSRGKYIRFHNENSSKTCPGTSINKIEFMNEVRGGVIEMLLKIGSRGPEVENLQIDLTKLGYDTKGIDGIFGVYTETALLAFQRDNKLEQDGIAGDVTLRAIEIVLSTPKVIPNPEIAILKSKVAALEKTVGLYQNKLAAIKNITEGK